MTDTHAGAMAGTAHYSIYSEPYRYYGIDAAAIADAAAQLGIGPLFRAS